MLLLYDFDVDVDVPLWEWGVSFAVVVLFLYDIYVMIIHPLGMGHVFCQMVMLYDIYAKIHHPPIRIIPAKSYLLIVMLSELE